MKNISEKLLTAFDMRRFERVLERVRTGSWQRTGPCPTIKVLVLVVVVIVVVVVLGILDPGVPNTRMLNPGNAGFRTQGYQIRIRGIPYPGSQDPGSRDTGSWAKESRTTGSRGQGY